MINFENHVLKGENIDYQGSPNKSGKFQAPPEFIVIHYTAGSSRESSVELLCKESTKASAHVVVGRDEKITQLVPLDMIAWHAGKSQWKDKVGLNKYSIGIEIDNLGKLSKVGNHFETWWGKKLDTSDEVYIDSEGSGWHRFTEWQLKTVFSLCELLIQQYPTIKGIVGHNEIAPGRKVDPGAAFPLEALRQQVLYSDRTDAEDDPEKPDLDSAKVTVSTWLNFRKKPTADADLVTEPLKPGTELEVVLEHEGWSKVIVPVEGWVSSQYLNKK